MVVKCKGPRIEIIPTNMNPSALFVFFSWWDTCWTSASTRSASLRPWRWNSLRCWWRSSATRYQRWSRASLTSCTFTRSDGEDGKQRENREEDLADRIPHPFDTATWCRCHPASLLCAIPGRSREPRACDWRADSQKTGVVLSVAS